MSKEKSVIGVIGAGAMGSGIAQIAAASGHRVFIADSNKESLERVPGALAAIFAKLREKGKITAEEEKGSVERLNVATDLKQFSGCDLVIEAVVEDLPIKQDLYRQLEAIVSEEAVLGTNTSSLSVTAIGSVLKRPERSIGIHFFNPAPLMPLVEIIPGLMTNCKSADLATKLVQSWGKTTVLAKDTPGFIVNRVARPFYGEALRILEEGIADIATIDWAMKAIAGFKMGPFELMDLIGNDINYRVTESVFESCYFDPRYKPSLLQKRLVEARLLGRKSGRGFYDYGPEAKNSPPQENERLGTRIVDRIRAMLINEAADAVLFKIASVQDIDTAMTKGVNYPKGLFAWADELGISQVAQTIDGLYQEYHEDRYRLSPLIRRMMRDREKFYPQQ